MHRLAGTVIFALLWLLAGGCCTTPPHESLTQLRQLETEARALFEATRPAVVAISNRGGRSCGSGTVVSPDGLIITAAHVVEGQQTAIIQFTDGRMENAEVLFRHSGSDTALIRLTIPPVTPLPCCPPDFDGPRPGDPVLTVGYPGVGGRGIEPTVRVVRYQGTAGLPGSPWYHIADGPINFGDSGGPLLDMQGRLLGVHVFALLNPNTNMSATLDPLKNSFQTWSKPEAAKRKPPAGSRYSGLLSEWQQFGRQVGTFLIDLGAALCRKGRSHPNRRAAWQELMAVIPTSRRPVEIWQAGKIRGLGTRVIDSEGQSWLVAKASEMNLTRPIVTRWHVENGRLPCDGNSNPEQPRQEHGFFSPSNVQPSSAHSPSKHRPIRQTTGVAYLDRSTDLAWFELNTSAPADALQLPNRSRPPVPADQVLAPLSRPNAFRFGTVSRPLQSYASVMRMAKIEPEIRLESATVSSIDSIPRKGFRLVQVNPANLIEASPLQLNDLLVEIDGRPVGGEPETRARLKGILTFKKRLPLRVIRDGKSIQLTVKPPRSSRIRNGVTDVVVWFQRRGLNRHRHGYRALIQTDLFLAPAECGGPLFNLRGEWIGINIARSGREKSYTLPTREIARSLAAVRRHRAR